MAAVESQMLALGSPAPEFSLPDPDGNTHSLADSASAYLVMFICNHCPFVKHVADELVEVAVETPVEQPRGFNAENGRRGVSGAAKFLDPLRCRAVFSGENQRD